MPKSPLELLHHIKEECCFLESVKHDLPSKEMFFENEVYKRAGVRSLEIIGEATKTLGNDFHTKWPRVKWREMALMRNILIHVYFGINYEIVWDVFKNAIPELQSHIEQIIETESQHL